MDAPTGAPPPPPADPEAEAEAEAMYARRGCCCFWIPWSGAQPPSSAEWWERVRGEEKASAERGGRWKRGKKTLMKIREWSEVVAGPRWKTFIRRFNRNSRHVGERRWKKSQYDASSYALNFDEGRDETPDLDGGFRDFSSRYAAIPVSAKSSMDLGGRDAPPLFTAAVTTGVIVH